MTARAGHVCASSFRTIAVGCTALIAASLAVGGASAADSSFAVGNGQVQNRPNAALGGTSYVGDSFLSIPGATGHWHGQDHKNWIRAEARQWPGIMKGLVSGKSDALAGDKLFFGGPMVPHPGGSGVLVITLGKNNPDLGQLMDKCVNKTTIPELTYAESSDLARPLMELGPRPAEFPAYWEYKLKDTEIVDCPVVPEADQQAFVLSFGDIDWQNYDSKRPWSTKLTIKPEDMPVVKPAEPSAKTRTKAYLVTWIAPNTDSTPEQCPQMNTKPTEADVFRYLSPEEIAQAKAKNGEKGIAYGTQSELRGPHKLNAVALPGIVPDPGMFEPRATVVDGIDLDIDDGSGTPPPGVCKHTNFVSPDGRKGIDNQYYRVAACIPGYSGKHGYRNQTSNARRADGNITTLIEVSNIHNEMNDDNVSIAIIHAMDKPIRDPAGSKFIPNYTFRTTSDPNFALYNKRVHGRIVNGVVISDPISKFELNLGQDPLLRLFGARMRFEILPDGSLRGVLAGYRDWHEIATTSASGYSEGLFNYKTDAFYYALKRNADGLKDPVTGECNGISIAYEIDAVPAFVTSAPPKVAKVAQDTENKVNTTR